jgi:hypothetical protein
MQPGLLHLFGCILTAKTQRHAKKKRENGGVEKERNKKV